MGWRGVWRGSLGPALGLGGGPVRAAYGACVEVERTVPAASGVGLPWGLAVGRCGRATGPVWRSGEGFRRWAGGASGVGGLGLPWGPAAGWREEHAGSVRAVSRARVAVG
ncbi:hypothetical protein GCM10010306_035940 [Streptomyces umbrinus]|nr:hypothetical protein GCM10010306_035940 [Streptomyces umbrinus]